MDLLIHPGFQTMFAKGHLTLGLFTPIEAYQGSIPTMRDHLIRARRAEWLGFAALWIRDIPLYDPSFGDVGQIYDPWVYLGHLARHTPASRWRLAASCCRCGTRSTSPKQPPPWITCRAADS